ncbi:uncharacterized protein LOC133278662 [Pezoporus flaviventris]|uniref:uncharacterized protein LOC133278662 n=1 Tax=Pezoporus flaviventris TaxID=889875 RepID=UPI002AB21385|nr:uncharacterized protein LOC133278662 [Pezoporus flaviventris]
MVVAGRTGARQGMAPSSGVAGRKTARRGTSQPAAACRRMPRSPPQRGPESHTLLGGGTVGLCGCPYATVPSPPIPPIHPFIHPPSPAGWIAAGQGYGGRQDRAATGDPRVRSAWCPSQCRQHHQSRRHARQQPPQSRSQSPQPRCPKPNLPQSPQPSAPLPRADPAAESSALSPAAQSRPCRRVLRPEPRCPPPLAALSRSPAGLRGRG